jgi:hypothetical protein
MFNLLPLIRVFPIIYTSGVDPTVLLYHPSTSHPFLKLLCKGKDRINCSFNWRDICIWLSKHKYHFRGKFLNCFVFFFNIIKRPKLGSIMWRFYLKGWNQLRIAFRYLLPKWKLNIMIFFYLWLCMVWPTPYFVIGDRNGWSLYCIIWLHIL